jgi:hypothetical protein
MTMRWIWLVPSNICMISDPGMPSPADTARSCRRPAVTLPGVSHHFSLVPVLPRNSDGTRAYPGPCCEWHQSGSIMTRHRKIHCK